MDLEHAATTPFDAGDEHRRLAALVGDWRGSARTWLDPTRPPSEAPWEGRIVLLLGGRYARHEYRSSVDGKPIAGELLIAYERGERLWRMTWIDSFHTSPAILVSTGVPGERAMRATGTYFAAEGHPRWGWRTELDDPEGDTLRVRMINIEPDGREDRAVELTLERAR
jgi:hypothetical protein